MTESGDFDRFVLGGITPSQGEPVGSITDIDANPDSETGERTREVKPYRRWTLAVVVLGLLGAVFGIWLNIEMGYTGGDVVAVTHPVSAVTYDSGIVEISVQTVPLKVCQSLVDCRPNQYHVVWRADRVLVMDVVREAPNGATWLDAVPCNVLDQVSSVGLIVLRSPTGLPPVAVIDGSTGKPVIVRQAGDAEAGPLGPGFANVPPSNHCATPLP